MATALNELKEFFRAVEWATAEKVNYADRERGVRLYRYQRSPDDWLLQVRTPMRLRNGEDGRDFIVASAHLDREQLTELRDAIDEFLGA
jgi:hypothetical protein